MTSFVVIWFNLISWAGTKSHDWLAFGLETQNPLDLESTNSESNEWFQIEQALGWKCRFNWVKWSNGFKGKVNPSTDLVTKGYFLKFIKIHAMTTHGLNQFAWSIQTTSKRIKSLFYFPLNYQCYKLKCALGFLSVLFSVSQHASSRGVPTNKTEYNL